jgi:hypothetical protein
MEVSGQLHGSSSLPPEKEPLYSLDSMLGPRFDLDAVENIKILHCRETNPDRAVCSVSLHRLSYPDSQFPLKGLNSGGRSCTLITDGERIRTSPFSELYVAMERRWCLGAEAACAVKDDDCISRQRNCYPCQRQSLLSLEVGWLSLLQRVIFYVLVDSAVVLFVHFLLRPFTGRERHSLPCFPHFGAMLYEILICWDFFICACQYFGEPG